MVAYRRDLAYVHAAGFESWIEPAVPALLRTLRNAGVAPGHHVVDLGCGSGLWVARLVRAGYRAMGIDASAAMIALARRRSPRAVFRTSAIARAAIPPCRAVTAFGECFNYRPGAALSTLFTRVHRALDPGGLFLFDVHIPAAGPVPVVVGHRVGRDFAVLVRAVERGRRLSRDITTFRRSGKVYRRSHEVHHLRLYTRAEVERALQEAGFSVRVRRRLGGTPLTGNRLAFFARRR